MINKYKVIFSILKVAEEKHNNKVNGWVIENNTLFYTFENDKQLYQMNDLKETIKEVKKEIRKNNIFIKAIQWFKRNKDADLYFYYRGESKWKQK